MPAEQPDREPDVLAKRVDDGQTSLVADRFL